MRSEKIYKILIVVILLSLFLGCKEGPLRFSVRYDTLGELRPNAPVYFDNSHIGHVEKIVSTDRGDYLVEVSIALEHKGKATENSKFFIFNDPFDSCQEALIIEQEPSGGAILKNGIIVHGEKRQGFLDRLMTSLQKRTQEASVKFQEAMQEFKESLSDNSLDLNEQMEKSLDDIDRYFQEFSNPMGSPLNEDSLQKMQESLDDFIEQFKLLNEDIQNLIRDEVLPQLHRNLENLRRWLEENGRENDINRIDDLINQASSV